MFFFTVNAENYISESCRIEPKLDYINPIMYVYILDTDPFGTFLIDLGTFGIPLWYKINPRNMTAI